MERAVENDIFEASLGIGVHQEVFAYSLRVYPSQELYDEYHQSPHHHHFLWSHWSLLLQLLLFLLTAIAWNVVSESF
jgi:hypothetical protein